MEETTKQVNRKIPNPTGKGGFQDHPELRNNGGRIKNPMKEHILKRFLEMTDEQKDEFLAPIDAYKRITLAEGNPRQDTDITTAGLPIIQIAGEIAIKYDITTSQPE